MKIKILRDDLLNATQITQNMISTQATLPILSNILIEGEKDLINLIATDLDIGIRYKLPADIDKKDAITVPAKKFSDIIRELSEPEVEITVKKNNSIDIKSGHAYFKLMGISKDEFPKLPNFEDKEFIKLPQAALKKMMEMCFFAASKDENRYVLNGILMEVKEDFIRLVGTDGRRLAFIEEKESFPRKIKKKLIIPLKTVNELIRNLSSEGEVKIIFMENQICFEFDRIMITSRLIEGDFPDYEQVIPKPAKDKIKVKKETFIKAIKRVALFTNPDSQAIKVDILKNKMILLKSAADLGEARDEINIDYDGSELSLGFNPNYLLDALKVLNEEEVRLELTHPQKPGVIREKGNYIYIILPMQTA